MFGEIYVLCRISQKNMLYRTQEVINETKKLNVIAKKRGQTLAQMARRGYTATKSFQQLTI